MKSLASLAARMLWQGFVHVRRSFPCTVCGENFDGSGAPTHVTGSSALLQHHARCCHPGVATEACQLIEAIRAQGPRLVSSRSPRRRQ